MQTVVDCLERLHDGQTIRGHLRAPMRINAYLWNLSSGIELGTHYYSNHTFLYGLRSNKQMVISPFKKDSHLKSWLKIVQMEIIL